MPSIKGTGVFEGCEFVESEWASTCIECDVNPEWLVTAEHCKYWEECNAICEGFGNWKRIKSNSIQEGCVS